jgi:hypothetical protein
MPSTKPTVGLLFDIQALQRQNEVNRKQTQKRRIEAKKEEFLQEQANKVESKIKRKNSKGKDLISRRRAAQLAQAKRAAKMCFKKAGISEEAEEIEVIGKDLNVDEAEETTKTNAGKETNGAEKTLKENDKAEQTKNVFADLDPEAIAKLTSDISNIHNKAALENWPELELDLSPGKSVLDQLLDPKNLVDSTATAEELAEAKSVAKLMSRFARQAIKSSLPTILDGAAKGLAEEGIDLTDSEMNPYLLDDAGELINPDAKPIFAGKKLESEYFQAPNQASPDAKVSIDHSIFASIFKAIEINQLLQELGIKSEVVANKVQNEMGKELLEEAEAQYKKNAEQIKKAKKQECMANTLRILGDVVGALFIYIGFSWIGVPIILASEGKIKEMITAMAKAFGVPEYVIQSIIVGMAVAVASALTIASIWIPGANVGVIAMSWSMVIMVAGMVGWFETTIGAMATGQFDSKKFPSWVTWAAMGVEIGLSLITMYQSIISAMRSAGNAIMNLPKTLSSLSTRMSTWGAQLSVKWASFGGLSGIGRGVVSAGRSAVSALKSVSAAAAIGKIGSAAKSAVRSVTSYVTTKFSQFVNYVKQAAKNFSDKMSQIISRMGTSGSSSGGGAAGGGQGSAVGSGSVSGARSGGVPTTSARASAPSPVVGQGVGGGGVPTSSTSVGGVPSETASLARSSKEASEAAKVVDATQGAKGAVNTPNSVSTPSQGVEMTHKMEKGVLTKLQEILQKLGEKIETLMKKLIEKLLKLKDWLAGADSAASQLAGAMKGAASVADRAEKIFNAIKRLIRLSQKLAKWLLLAAQGAQAVVQIEMGKIQLEMAEVLEEAAELAGEITLIQQFLRSINVSIRSLQQSKKQYSQDSADQIEKLGSILTSQRRSENLLMSA